MAGSRSKCESPSPVQFFKYIPPGLLFDPKLMTIPEAFTKFLKSTWKKKTAILTRGSLKWPVTITDNWGFGPGWEDFVRENGVEDSNFVLFKHQGDMVFDISVFDNNMCEKENPTRENHVLKKSRKDTNALKKNPIKKETTIPDDDDDQHSYFIQTLKSEYKLYLPTSFTRPNELGDGEMIVRNGKTQKFWTIRLKSYYLGKGWHNFCIENGLKKGDRFKFELVKNGIKPEANCYGLGKETIKGKVVKNPCFRSIVTSYAIKDSCTDIPMKFARLNGFVGRTCESVVMDEKRRLWETKIRGTSYRARLQGMKKVWDANKLKEGDEFIVELVENGEKPILNLHGMKRNNVKRLNKVKQMVFKKQK